MVLGPYEGVLSGCGVVCILEFSFGLSLETAANQLWDVRSCAAECARGSFFSCPCQKRPRRKYGMYTRQKRSVHVGVFTRALAGGGHELIMGCTLARRGVYTRELLFGLLPEAATSKYRMYTRPRRNAHAGAFSRVPAGSDHGLMMGCTLGPDASMCRWLMSANCDTSPAYVCQLRRFRPPPYPKSTR